MEYKTIIDSNGYITNMCVIYKDGKVQDYKMNENEEFVEYYVVKGYIKPRWNGNEWVEGATEEEIQESKEENKVVQTPTTEELLLKEIANLKIEIMQLKGGNA